MPWLLLMLLTCLWAALAWPQGLPMPGPGARTYTAGGGGTTPVRTGTPTANNGGTANTGSVSLTLAADAQLLVCTVSGYASTASYFSTGSLTIASAAMTVVTGGDSSTANWMAALFYRVSPTTGTQTLAWDWAGTGTRTEEALIMCSTYTSVNVADAVRLSACKQTATNPHDSGTLAAVANDLVIGFVTSYSTSENSFVWTNATEVSEFARQGAADGGLAEITASGTLGACAGGGNGVCATGAESQDGGMCALVLKPS